MKKLDTEMLTDIITNADKWPAGTIVQFSYANKEMTLSKASSESFNYTYEITFVTGPMIQSYKFRTIEDAMVNYPRLKSRASSSKAAVSFLG